MFDKDYEEYQHDVSELVAHYEEMEKNNGQCFFEESSLEQIIDYYEAKQKSERALSVVDLAIAQYPFSSSFLIKKAEILFDNKQFDQALYLLDKAEIFDPQDIQVSLLRADIYVWMEDYKKAVTTIEGAIEKAAEEEVSDLYLELADIYEDSENYDMVFESLKKTLLLEGANEEALNRMWFCVEFTEKYVESVEFHQYLIDQDPYNYLAWFNIAHAYSRMKEYDLSIDAFEFVMAINEKYDYAYKDCGDVLFKKKDYSMAAEYYKTALNLGKPSKELFYSTAECYEKLKNHSQARYYYRKAINVDPSFASAFYKIGVNYNQEKRWNNAIGSFQKAYKLNPDNAEYNNALAEVYKANNDLGKATEHFAKAVETCPTKKEYWVKLAKTFFEAGEYKNALITIDSAAVNFENAADLYFIKSAFYYQIGNKNEAYLNLETALLQDYKDTQVIFDIAPNMGNDPNIINIIDQYR